MLGRPVDKHTWNSDGRLEFIGEMAKQYKVDGIVSEIVRFCCDNGFDRIGLKDQMKERGVPILDLDVEYGEGGSGQMRTRVEAFLEMLESRVKGPTGESPNRNVSK